MSDDILVVDDFLPPRDYENLARLVSNVPMEYGSLSNFKTDSHGHWSRKFVRAGRHNLADVSWVLSENAALAPLNTAWEFLRQSHLPNDNILIRCYLNGYTYGVDGYFHCDSCRTDELTAIVYVNDHWEPDWAGETAFLDEQGDIVKSVLPRRNRLVIFPANMMHVGRGVSRKCMVLRRTMIYKTRKKRSANFEKLSLFLRKMGATNRSHKEGTLHDHLVRTFAILEKRGSRAEVCFGGGLHSIYGTNILQQGIVTPESRLLISNEFGNEAEELAFLFSTLERPQTLESPLKVLLGEVVVEGRDKQTFTLRQQIFNDLRKIEC